MATTDGVPRPALNSLLSDSVTKHLPFRNTFIIVSVFLSMIITQRNTKHSYVTVCVSLEQ